MILNVPLHTLALLRNKKKNIFFYFSARNYIYDASNVSHDNNSFGHMKKNSARGSFQEESSKEST